MTFSDFIKSQSTSHKLLPLTHATDVEGFNRIFPTGKIVSEAKCPVFSEHIIYLFYGRPAYRVNAKNFDTFSSISYAPVCFVIKPEIPNIKRIYPFDTGGFERYKKFFHRTQKLEDFAIEPRINSPQKLIFSFYHSNQLYYDLSPLKHLLFGPTETALQNYYDLITMTGEEDIDDRSSTVELQVEKYLDLVDRVLAVIMPLQMLEDVEVTECLTNWKATPLTYKLNDRFRPIEFTSQINRLLEDFFREKEFL